MPRHVVVARLWQLQAAAAHPPEIMSRVPEESESVLSSEESDDDPEDVECFFLAFFFWCNTPKPE